MRKILLLDLEETVIPEFGDFYVPDYWGHCLRDFVKQNNFDEVRIFSWAIYNDSDKSIFVKFSHDIATEIGTSFSHTYTIEEIIALIQKHCGISLADKNDFFDFYKKERVVFDLLLHGWSPNTHIILLDDAVTEMILETNGSKFEAVNFNKLLSEF